MRKKPTTRQYIEPDAFKLARKQAGLSVKTAAIELDVNERTIRNYENGAVRVPYPAFRLLRLLAGYQLVGTGRQLNNHWNDWSFWQNKLWTPEGRSFEAHELRYVATYISLARHFIKSHEPNSQETSSFAAEKVLEIMRAPKAVRERPSSATALFGAKVAHESPGQIGRSLAFRKSEV